MIGFVPQGAAMQPELRPVVGDVVVTDGTVPRGPIPAPPLGVPESTAVPAGIEGSRS